MNRQQRVDAQRRASLKLMLAAGGGLLLQGVWPPASAATALERPGQPTVPVGTVGYFATLHPDGSMDFVLTRHDMGQGVGTALAMVFADELGARWDSLHVRVPDTTETRYQLGSTGGSNTVKDAWLPVRQGAALVREALIGVAARRWQVPPADCRAQDGQVQGPRPSQRLPFGALAEEAASLGAPDNYAAFRTLTPVLRPLGEFKLSGKPQVNVFAPAIVRGAHPYGIDAALPGMLHASVERAPMLRGRVASVDASRALRVPGVRQVVQVDAYEDAARTVPAPALFTSTKAAVAVLADNTWAAMQGRKALAVTWQASGHAAHSNASWEAEAERLLATQAKVVVEQGSPPAEGTGQVHSADYVFPFQAHACMEPMNCLAHHQGGQAEVWVSTQGAGPWRQRIADHFKLAPDKVVVHPMFSGGAFGRRSYADTAIEALKISQAAGHVPVKVLWTREDDLRHDHYHPHYHGRFRAVLRADGALASFEHRELRAYWGDPSGEIPWFAYDTAHQRYAFANGHSPSPLQAGAWRAVVANNWAFGQESFVDELAHLAGQDPLALRLMWLASGADKPAGSRYTVSNARLQGVLRALRRHADWGRPAAPLAGMRVGRGLAVYPYMHGDSYAAMAVDVAVDGTGALRITRVVVVADCGQVVNPSGAHQQAVGGIAWGLSAALFGGIRLEGGAVQNSNFHDTPVLRQGQMPQRIDVHFISDPARPPTGLGEITPPLVAPALCNAVFAATGQRLRRLPLGLTLA